MHISYIYTAVDGDICYRAIDLV